MVTRRDVLFVVLVLLVTAVAWSVLFKSEGEPISLKDFVGLLPSLITLLGTAKEGKKRGRGTRSARQASRASAVPPSPPVVKPFHLVPSFDSGLYGGIIGGALAGLIIGVAYYISTLSSPWPVKAWWDIIPHVFVYASLAGTLLGALSQLSILWFRYLVTERKHSALVFNEVNGGILGGVVAGIPVGALGGWLFGQRPIPFPDVSLLCTGAAFGTIFIILGTLLYDYEGSWRKVIRALVVSAVITTFAATFGIAVIQSLKIAARFFSGSEALLVTEGGAIIGCILGIVLGLQVGLTLFLYRLWEVKSEPIRS